MTGAAYLIAKYLFTAAVVVLVSEVARRSERIGAVLASLPLVTVLTLIWLHVEGQTTERVSGYASYTFWYVLLTLPMFLVFPWLMARMGFWESLLASATFTAVCIVAFALVMKRFGVVLM